MELYNLKSNTKLLENNWPEKEKSHPDYGVDPRYWRAEKDWSSSNDSVRMVKETGEWLNPIGKSPSTEL